MFLLTDTRNFPSSNSPFSKTRHVRFQLHSKVENILENENNEPRNSDEMKQINSSPVINHSITKASQDSPQEAGNTTKDLIVEQRELFPIHLTNRTCDRDSKKGESKNVLAADNGRLAAAIILLNKKNEETSKKLDSVQGRLVTLKVEKNNLQEKLIGRTSSERILKNEKKELEKTNVDLEFALQRLEEGYDELEEELFEKREFGIQNGRIIQQRSKELRLLQVRNTFLEEKLEAHVAAELVLTKQIEELQNRLQGKDKLDKDYKQSLKEKFRLQNKMDGLRDVVGSSTEVLMLADGIVKDLEIQVMDRSFRASQLSCELEAAFEHLREIEEMNKVNLTRVKCETGVKVNEMRKDFKREMNNVMAQKEEEQVVLMDRIAALNDVLEGTTEELSKAHDSIRAMEIKEMDRAFYISELSRELDVALERLRQTEGNINTKLGTVSDTQAEKRNVYLVAEYEEHIGKIDIQKRKAVEIAKRLDEAQLKAEEARLEFLLLEKTYKEQEKIIAQLKGENLKKTESIYIDATRRSLSEEWSEYHSHKAKLEESALSVPMRELNHLVKSLREKTFFLGGFFD